MLPGAKTTGSAFGLAGAAAYSPELTVLTKHHAGYPVDPATLEAAVTKLTEAAWGGILIGGGLLGALIANYYWRRAQERWGNGAPETKETDHA
jgi:hypothetical protein